MIINSLKKSALNITYFLLFYIIILYVFDLAGVLLYYRKLRFD